MAAHPAQPSGLQHAQQLGLQVERQLADFVEDQGAARGFLEPAELALAGAGEGAALVPEELALGQLAGQGAAIDGHEGAVGDGAQLVQGARQQLLAGAAFAGDQHGQPGARDAAGLFEDAQQGRRLADDGAQGRDGRPGEGIFVHAEVLGRGRKKLRGNAEDGFGRGTLSSRPGAWSLEPEACLPQRRGGSFI